MSPYPVRSSLAIALLLPAAGMAQTAASTGTTQSTSATPASTAAAKPAAASKDQPAIQTVEVKGAASSYDPRRDDTASKTVINAEEIRKYGDDNIFDVLKRAPGVTVTGKTIRMRGLGAGYTQILVNGDRPPPGFSLDTLTPDQIERIEVVRAASAEFSMQSIAGTINIVLRKLVSKPQHDLRLGLMHSSQQNNGNVNGTWAEKVGSFSYFLNGSLYGGKNTVTSTSTDRFTLPSGQVSQERNQAFDGGGSYRGIALFPRVAWKFENGDELNLSAGGYATRSDWDNVSRTDNLVGTFATPDYVENFSSSPATQRMLRGEVNWIARLAGGKLDLTLSHERTRNTNDDDDTYYTAGRALRLLRAWDSTVHARRESLRAKYTRSLFDGHALAAGIDTSVQENDEVRVRDEQLGTAAPTRAVDRFAPRVTRFAAYAQDEWSIDKQLSLYLGARWEGVHTDSSADSSADSSGDTVSAGSAADSAADVHARNHVLGPVLQALYKFPGASGRQLRLALTRTYKAPTIDQLTARRYYAAVNTRFNADAGGNPDLRPELAKGIDVAYEHYLAQGAMVSVSVSRRAITDYIRSRLDLDPDGRWVVRPLNDGDALVRSLETELKTPGKLLGDALAAFDLRASLARNWSQVSSVPAPGNRLDAQTPLSGTVGVDYRKGDLSLGSSFSYQKGAWVRVSEFQSQRQFIQRNLDAYALWKFNPRYQLRLSLSNILQQDTRQDRLYRDAAGTSRERSFQPGVRRAGVNLEMKL